MQMDSIWKGFFVAVAMMRWWVFSLKLVELFVSSLVHMAYGFYIFSTAVAGDVLQAFSDLFSKPNVIVGEKDDESDRSTNAEDLPPIVLVHGIFGFGKGRLGALSYFGGAEKRDDRVLVPDLGSLTSIYDRARELFYYLKGGQVDYGEEHSHACGHSQFGRVYEQGHYPEWDENHPVHFVGHSAGAQVVRVLQQMLADKAFKGHDSSENWVISITALSGAFNGTTRAYLDGMQPEDGKTLKPLCLLQLCRIGVILYDWFDISWLKAYYNFGFDHFNMSWKNTGIRGLGDLLLGNTGPFASGDWILPDLTIQGSVKLNSHLRTFPNTYYFSYATKMTSKVVGFAVPSGISSIHPLLFSRVLQMTNKVIGHTLPSKITSIHPLLFIRVLQMCQWRHPSEVPPPCKGYSYATKMTSKVMGCMITYGISSIHPHRLLQMTSKVMAFTVPSGISSIHPLLFIRVLQMCHWRHPSDDPPPYRGYSDEEWWDNDGALNTISMTHPRFPVEHPNHLVVKDSECPTLHPGIWYYKYVEGDHILFIVNRERAGVQFDLIYDSIFERCRKHVFTKRPTMPDHALRSIKWLNWN